MKPEIKLIEPLGFWYGVKRAVNLARGVLEDNPRNKVYSLGQIIHNRDAVGELSRKGLIVKDDLKGTKILDLDSYETSRRGKRKRRKNHLILPVQKRAQM